MSERPQTAPQLERRRGLVGGDISRSTQLAALRGEARRPGYFHVLTLSVDDPDASWKPTKHARRNS